MKTIRPVEALLILFFLSIGTAFAAEHRFYSASGALLPTANSPAHENEAVPEPGTTAQTITTTEGATFNALGTVHLTAGTPADGILYLKSDALTVPTLFRTGYVAPLITADQLPQSLKFPTNANLMTGCAGLTFLGLNNPGSVDPLTKSLMTTLVILDGTGAITKLLSPLDQIKGTSLNYSGSMYSISCQLGIVSAVVIDSTKTLHLIETRDLVSWKDVVNANSGFDAMSDAVCNANDSSYIAATNFGPNLQLKPISIYRVTSGVIKQIRAGSLSETFADMTCRDKGVQVAFKSAAGTLQYSFLDASNTEQSIISAPRSATRNTIVAIADPNTAYISNIDGTLQSINGTVTTTLKTPIEAPGDPVDLEISGSQVLYILADRSAYFLDLGPLASAELEVLPLLDVFNGMAQGATHNPLSTGDLALIRGHQGDQLCHLEKSFQAPLPKFVDGCEVLLTAKNGVVTPASINAVSATALTVVLPFVPPGEYILTVKDGVRTAKQLKVGLVSASPKFLTYTVPGKEDRYLFTLSIGPNGLPSASRNAVLGGSKVTLWPLSGLGITNPQIPEGENMRATAAAKVTVTVNGSTDAEVTFAGLPGSSPGMDSMEFFVPPSVDTVNSVRIEVTSADGSVSRNEFPVEVQPTNQRRR